MNNDKELIKWYLESGVDEIIEDKSVDHFELYKTKKEQKQNLSTITFENREIKQTLANNTKNMISEKPNINYNEIAKKVVSDIKDISDLKREIEKFEGCGFIKSLAKNTVISRGNIKGNIMIVGEAPGAEEDAQGIPFCGQSGQLLDNMLRAIELYDSVYITNTTFWRPPGNRRPTEEELYASRPFVEKHIALINPKLIIAMGATAMSVILNKSSGVTEMRRKFFDYTNEYLDGKIIKATPLFHPSFLLRQPARKRDAWKDWLIVKEFLEKK